MTSCICRFKETSEGGVVRIANPDCKAEHNYKCKTCLDFKTMTTGTSEDYLVPCRHCCPNEHAKYILFTTKEVA